MELNYTYSKILRIAKEVKKLGIKVGQLVEIVQFIFTNENVLHIFVREGCELKSDEEAIEAIGEAMANGEDYFDIQKDVLQALINANFYKKELQEMLSALTEAPMEKSKK